MHEAFVKPLSVLILRAVSTSLFTLFGVITLKNICCDLENRIAAFPHQRRTFHVAHRANLCSILRLLAGCNMPIVGHCRGPITEGQIYSQRGRTERYVRRGHWAATEKGRFRDNVLKVRQVYVCRDVRTRLNCASEGVVIIQRE